MEQSSDVFHFVVFDKMAALFKKYMQMLNVVTDLFGVILTGTTYKKIGLHSKICSIKV